MNNLEIAKLLRAITAAYIIKNENRFKVMAYERAADSIEHSTSEIKDLWEDGKLGEIPGIGPSIAAHLDELFKTGKVKHFEKIMKGLPPAMFPLLSVPGFGPKKAYKLVKILKLVNPSTVIEDLERAAKEGKIAQLASFGEKSQEDILEALQTFKEGQVKEKRMVLPIASAIAQEVISYLKKCPASVKVDPLGSLRRKVATIGDIDVAVATEKPEQVVEWFVAYPKRQKVIESGQSGATLLLENGRQVDLRVQKPKAYGAMLQYFTGSKHHNIHLRELALKKGLSLSEYGIKRGKKLKEYSIEEEFYTILGLDWIPPELREDAGEIEAALAHRLPKLIELKDVKGDLHVHSDYPLEPSHDLGVDSMEVIIKKAEKLGYEYIGFAEHSPSITNHTKQQIYEILARRKEKIEKLKLTSKIVRVINLLEVDILADGNLSIEDKSLNLLDGAIASVHSSFNQPKEKMTKRILSALANHHIRILGHPTGRMLGKREAYEADWDKIFTFCKAHNKALEINAWPDRLDLPDSLVHQAVKMGVKMVISTDSHAAEQMDLMTYGIAVARRGWAGKGDILNTLSYNKFITWLKGGEK
ncbi:MAG: DNA polymerase (family X) [Microgenomates group bacterium LiPW_16]|nr:MAG: DNA polymerase (family X) [Microgenomates group bacterium LiPW_16]